MVSIPNFIKIGQMVSYLANEDGRMDSRTDVTRTNVI